MTADGPMKSYSCSMVLLWSIFYLPGFYLSAQNLVPNPSFETYATCPVFYTQPGDPLPCQPWLSPTAGTSDYFNACAVQFVDVPTNISGYQYAHTGDAYGGFILKSAALDYHEYLQVQLDQPLVAGTYYYVSFYVSLADAYCGIEHIGAFFSVFAPASMTGGHLDLIPQVESNTGYLSNKLNWTLISGCYLASGSEQYITIGNFHGSWDTPTDPTCSSNSDSYYFIDDVTVMDTIIEDLIFDLGGPVTACYNYTIDPGVSGNSYEWSDGSHDPTLTVDQSGTYSVTISSGCTIGDAEIDVTIIGGQPVEIALDDVTICQGEVVNISLDPSLGDYEWSDGSVSPQYQINSTGEYSVTLDDGCELTTDMITVQVLQPPDPFSLGADTTLCDGDHISFSFDPLLGDFAWNDGSSSPTHSLDEDGIFTLTISNMCGESTDDINVDIIDIPEIELGDDDVNLCFGDELILSLDPDAGTYVWQDGSTNSTFTITSGGEYSVIGSNICGQNSDFIFVEELYPPFFDLGDNVTICPGQIPFELNVSNVPHATNIQWQDGSLEPVYQVTNPGLYYVTVSNECFSSIDSIDIFVQDATPTVVLPENLILCPGELLALSNSGSIGNYLWQDSTIADTFLVSHSGIYSLTITNACGSGRDTVDIQYLPSIPFPDLGPDASLCPGEQITLSPGLSGVSYVWQDLSTADSFLVTTAGMYFLKVFNQCDTAFDTIQIVVNNNPPQLALPAQLTLCQGQDLTINSGISGVSYLWNDNSNADSLHIIAPGSYSLTVSNTCGTDVDTVIILDGGSAPFVSIGSDVSLCPGDNLILSPAFSDVNNWLWNDGSSLPSYSITGNEVVTVQVSNDCGTAYDTLLSTLLPATPPIDLGHDTSICPGSSLLLNINTPNVNIEWSDGSVNSQFLVEDEGNYYVTISNLCGANADTIHIALLPDAPDLNLGIDQSLCPGETITLDPGISNATYLWQDGSTVPVFNATQAGTIILSVTNACGTDIDTLEIAINTDGPHVNLGPDILACEGDVVTIESDISGVDYLWQDGSTDADFSTSNSGTYILQVSNNCGVDTDTVNVDINGNLPDTYLGADTVLCSGTTLLLSSMTDPGTVISWQDGSSLPTFLVVSAGTYILSESNHCGDHMDSVLVSYVNAPATFDLGSDTSLCPGETLMLTAPQTNDHIVWQDGSSSPFIIADQAQIYSLAISNQCGVVSDHFLLSFDDHTPVIDMPPMSFLCPGDELEINATQAFPATYSWNTGSILPAIKINSPGKYSVDVHTDCMDTHGETEVLTSDTCFAVNTFFIPNIFSPNGDNINDVFSIKFNSEIQVHALQTSIFDRWGNMVFQSDAIPFEWNGDFNGKSLSPGVYVYRIEMRYFDKTVDRDVLVHGDVTLIR